VTHVYNHTTQKTEAGRSRVGDQPELHSETNQNKTKKFIKIFSIGGWGCRPVGRAMLGMHEALGKSPVPKHKRKSFIIESLRLISSIPKGEKWMTKNIYLTAVLNRK
jgi:hypothetical protein